MEAILEESLESHTDRKRRDEMDVYGRSDAYRRLHSYLKRKGERLKVFDLINYVPAIVDDKIDALGEESLDYLEHARLVLQQCLAGRDMCVSTDEERMIIDLGNTLNKMASGRFRERAIGRYVSRELLRYWEIEEKNIQRRWRILGRKELDDLAQGIGGSVSAQFLCILDPSLDCYETRQLTNGYGLAIKLADNICDFREDIVGGFVNVPLEDLNHLQGVEVHDNKVTKVDTSRLALSQDYIQKEFERTKNLFESTDRAFYRIAMRRLFWEKGLPLFQQIAYSWFRQLQEFMTIEILKKHDINSQSNITFLSADELHKIEKRYGWHIADVIKASYIQENRNTRLVREKDPAYNPYSHKKTPEANEKIMAMIQKHPEIRDVLDFGCDDGERTINLYGGKDIYGIELVETAANEARKKGISVYPCSMISDVYRDTANPKGRKFDLVSIVGEMVNFVGLDTDTLLAKTVKQVKDKGYLLVSCIHPEFKESQEGKYVVWSHTKSTQGRWLLDELKIPRTFLLLSEQGLQQRLNKVARHLGCRLSIQDKDTISNYYENIPLAIYLFRKEK